MKQKVILDTSPLVAFIDRGDRFHNWTLEVWQTIAIPLLTCEAVISEGCFLLRKTFGGQEAIISLLRAGVLQIPFHISDEIAAIEELMKRYQSVPMSLADACLVRMVELSPVSEILTLDSDFRVYRKHRNQLIPVMIPEEI
ncbi:MAG: type II toxin-antitoxin system VapC family toxin [Microcystaceae cyanobacterium]